MGATNCRLKADQVKDYQQMLESISELVLEGIRQRKLAVVRRWAASLAHVGRVLLDDRAARGPKAA